MSRDLDLARGVLDVAERLAAEPLASAEWLAEQPNTFAAHALARLDMGEREYSERWRDLGPRRLVGEMIEEAADIGGWGTLALQALRDTGLDIDEPSVRLILCALTLGAEAHADLERAQSLLDDDQDEAQA